MALELMLPAAYPLGGATRSSLTVAVALLNCT